MELFKNIYLTTPEIKKKKKQEVIEQMGQIENKEQNVDLQAIKLIIMLNVKGLNTPNKRQIVRIDKKARPKYMLSMRKTLSIQDMGM